MSTQKPYAYITEIQGALRVVPLSGLPEGMAGAALVDAKGTEIERIAAPAARFDADAAFLRLDTRRNVIAGYLERLQDAVNTDAYSPAVMWLGVRSIAAEVAPHVMPWLLGAAQTWLLWRLGSPDFAMAVGTVEVFAAFALVAVALQSRQGPGERALFGMVVTAFVAVLVIFALFVAGAMQRWPGLADASGYLSVGLLGAIIAQSLLVLWLRSAWAPLPGLLTYDLSTEPAASQGVAVLCLDRHDGRAIPSLAVRYDTAAGTPAFYALLPLRRVDRSPRTALTALANAASWDAHDQQRDAALAAASRERLAALEESMRQMDG